MMLFVFTIVLYCTVFVFGTIIGSFLAVLVYRIPRGLDFMRGRSFCPNCTHRLKGFDLIPLISYLTLKGRCRYCRRPIPLRSLFIELAGGVLAVCSWAAFTAHPTLLQANTVFFESAAPPLAALLYFAVLGVLLVITLIDADTMEIPDGLNFALLICGVLAIFVAPELPLISRVIGLFCVSVPLFVIALIVPGAFGGGDVKLMAAAGFLLGWQGALVAIVVGVLIGGGWGIYLMASGRKGAKGHFAFGPALCAGITTALFFGTPLINWYGSLF
jgi:leader peptidase (prepilin peptidase)/N-methyltransferase